MAPPPVNPETPRPRVAYYAHHHGSGHLRHAMNIARLQAVNLLVTGSTEPEGLSGIPQTKFAHLTADTWPDGAPYPVPGDQFLHYTPTNPAIRQRFAELQAAWQDFDPQVVVIDVSAEAAVFARLSGYPVLYRRMPGDRWDPAHEAAYASATGLFAYYPRELEDPAYLERLGHRTTYLGMLAPTGEPGAAKDHHGGKVITVQTSLGGNGVSATELAEAARSCPDWQWNVVGLSTGSANLPANVRLLGVLADPRPELARADIIITSAGYHAVAAAASAGRPTILVPEERPFAEQAAFARALRDTAGIPMAESWSGAAWPELLQQAAATDPEALKRELFVSSDSFRDSFLDLVSRAAAAGS
ncbi:MULTISPECIES: glycosyltransferase [unclassified Arthrobacter]|uniref:glycosyltransferase n=1 Tax=unclassified Arthrobacter TaxID=235627 RepID=UPI00149120E1|nr:MULTISPECIES: glycosyltransferase [unclassified Arthrobacter]NOJ62207.1 glycosyl transferase [Arthrobacter sp. 147(2020)]